MFLEADQMISGGQIGEALEVLQDILNEDPSFAQAHNHLGWIYDTQMIMPSLAEEHFKHAIHFNPDYPSPYFNYTELLLIQSRFVDAEIILKKAFDRKTINRVRIYFLLGRVFEMQQRYEEAKKHYVLSVTNSADPKNFEVCEEAITRCKKKEELLSEE